MHGLRDWVDSLLVGLFNVRGLRRETDTMPQVGPDDFLIGVARPFGTDGPAEGEMVSVPLSVFTKHGASFGASGSGKTTITHRLRDAFVAASINIIDIDFRGDGFDRALKRLVAAEVPSERLTLIDLRDRDRITPLNLLGKGPGDPHTRAAVVFEALRAQAPSWGVQLGSDLRALLVALAEDGGSLLDVAPALAPEGANVRQALLHAITDEYARDFLTTYDTLPPDIQRNRAAAVTNKLDEFLYHPALRLALGAASAPDLGQMMDEPGHITLVALGADRNPQAALVGRMLVGAVQRAAMARVDIREAGRNPVRLLVDEAQNLLSEESCQILAEGRRFKLGIWACAQFSGQLLPELRASVKVNCATQLYFQTSAAEASDIAGEVVSSLTKDEVRETLLAAPVGAALAIRRGEPAAFVTTPDSPDPDVEPEPVAAVRQAALERTTIPWADAKQAQRALASLSQSQPEVLTHERKPFKRRRQA
jgi:hypothetical protein